ncbi:hypothetical protein OIU84_008837 [Salix udensis]|uniref:Uncharacterized protein n=1 Tax=Salix udensis TaxID=889485 RepID=A0AAD6JS43_9ROSI|nr:hypothetical protein OIU84_008837 [Salix udensis]
MNFGSAGFSISAGERRAGLQEPENIQSSRFFSIRNGRTSVLGFLILFHFLKDSPFLHSSPSHHQYHHIISAPSNKHSEVL